MERFRKIWRTNREIFVMKIRTRIQYFNATSSLRSVGHVISLARTSLFKRLFWLGTLAACCYGSASVLRGALGLYLQDAVSYSVETDYLAWDTPFPAITVCEFGNLTNVKIVLEKKYSIKKAAALKSFFRDISIWNRDFCKSCTNCKVDVNCIENFVPVLDLIRAPCEELMAECSFNGEEFPCCERFKPMATEFGKCYSFNSHYTDYGQIVHVNRIIGLPTLTFRVISRAWIRVHPPTEMVSIATENILGACSNLLGGMDFELDVVAEEIVNDVSVHSIAPGSRDCLFEDEIPSEMEGWPFDEFSQSGCAWYCRAMAHVHACNCSSHFMPKLREIPMCNIQGLKCLYANRKSIETDKGCDCPMSCAEITYTVVNMRCPKVNGESLETIGKVRMGHLPHLRVRRQAIRDMLGLVVDIGGVVGVFFGASLLSFIEVVYIFCIRKYY